MTGQPVSALMSPGMDSATFQALARQAEKAEWTTLHELAAQQIEMTHNLIRTIVQVVTKQDPGPIHVPRPSDKPPDPVRMADVAHMLGRVR